jgi:phytoene dehydrogenase-like protein
MPSLPTSSSLLDAIIVGAGPNGLAAAVTLARAGRSVLVLEAMETIGGGTHTEELTLPGFKHDVCSAIHPLGVASPFFRSLPLEKYGLKWVFPPVAVAHPLDDGSAGFVTLSIDETIRNLGKDGRSYQRLFAPLLQNWERILPEILGPFLIPPRHPFAMARFGLAAIRSARGLADSYFKGERARALFAGMAAHSMLPLEDPLSASFGVAMTLMAHAAGWPVPLGGSHTITDALAAYFCSLGGEIRTGARVESLDQLPPARAVLFDLTPRQLVKIAGDRLPEGYRRRLGRYRYGVGVCKVDFALDGPIPWKAPECRQTGTVHVGGTLEEISASERETWRGEHPERPFVLVAQQSLFDPSRAPQGKHTAWAYCHVPNGSTVDMTGRITAQIERFAPGFRDLILAKNTRTAVEMEQYNPNYIGGDINGGVQDWRQFFTRPTISLSPYTTPAKGIYLCSSSTPPGGGVHGMCGYHAAQAVIEQLRKGRTPGYY